MRFQVDRWTDDAGELLPGGFGSAGDLSDSWSLNGAFDYAKLTAKGAMGAKLYGASSQLGDLALGGKECNTTTDPAQLAACRDQKTAAMAAALGSYAGAIGTLIGGPLVGSGVAAAVAALVKAIQAASSGPGWCVDPGPPDPASDWRGWPYQWKNVYGSDAGGAPGSFEEYANTLGAANMALLMNIQPCDQTGKVWGMPTAAVIAAAIASWNATHSTASPGSIMGIPLPGVITISRSGLNTATPGGFKSGTVYPGPWDPIAEALNEAAIHDGLVNATLSFQVNNGPAMALGFGPNLGAIVSKGPGLSMKAIQAVGTKAAPTATSATTKVVLGAGAAIVAVALLKPALLKGLPVLGKLARVGR
jgi:hypothetical protein